MTGNAMTGSATTGGATTGLRWSHLFFLLSTWALVSIVALLVVGLAWTLRLKPQALQDARAQRQDIVRVLAGLADAQLRDKLDVLGPLAAHFAQSWASLEPRALQREIDTMRAMLKMPTLFVVSPDGRPLAFSPLTGADGTSNPSCVTRIGHCCRRPSASRGRRSPASSWAGPRAISSWAPRCRSSWTSRSWPT